MSNNFLKFYRNLDRNVLVEAWLKATFLRQRWPIVASHPIAGLPSQLSLAPFNISGSSFQFLLLTLMSWKQKSNRLWSRNDEKHSAKKEKPFLQTHIPAIRPWISVEPPVFHMLVVTIDCCRQEFVIVVGQHYHHLQQICLVSNFHLRTDDSRPAQLWLDLRHSTVVLLLLQQPDPIKRRIELQCSKWIANTIARAIFFLFFSVVIKIHDTYGKGIIDIWFSEGVLIEFIHGSLTLLRGWIGDGHENFTFSIGICIKLAILRSHDDKNILYFYEIQ